MTSTAEFIQCEIQIYILCACIYDTDYDVTNYGQLVNVVF